MLLRCSFIGSRRSTTTLRRQSPRVRLAVEGLEERLTPNNRFVVPLEVPADDSVTFHALQRALTKTGLTGGDTIEIKQGAEPGAVPATSITVPNLTIGSEAGVAAADMAPITFLGAMNLGVGTILRGLNIVATNTVLMPGSAQLNGCLVSCSTPSDNAVGIQVFADAGSPAKIVNSTITSTATMQLIEVVPGAGGSNNLIAGNTLRAIDGTTLIRYRRSERRRSWTSFATTSSSPMRQAAGAT